MFIGHFAPAFIAAAVSPRSPRLGTLFVAAQLVDIGFAALLFPGLEAMRTDRAGFDSCHFLTRPGERL